VLTDARTLPEEDVIRCDVCIIGGGAAGITAALELANQRRNVVLLEGGGPGAEAEATDTYRGELVGDALQGGDAHPSLESLRQKQLGGTTASWGGRCRPLDAAELARWPVGLAELEPYYRQAHAYLELGEYEYTAEVAVPNAGPFLTKSGQAALIDDGRVWRYSPPTRFGKTYAERLRDAGGPRVFHHATVVALEACSGGFRVVGARVATAPRREFRVEAKAYVLAAGGLETTRLLLLSRRKGLALASQALGSFYMTHLDGVVGRVRFPAGAPRAAYSYERSRDGVYCRRVVSLNERVRAREGLLNLGFVFNIPPVRDPSHGDGLLSAFALSKELLSGASLDFKSARYRIADEPLALLSHVQNIARDAPRLVAFGAKWTRDRILASRKLPSFLVQPRSGVYTLLFNAEQSPTTSNRVTLAEACDAFAVPRLRVAWKPTAIDYESTARTFTLIGDELRRLGLAVDYLPTTVEELRASLGGGFKAGTHAMGTTRMGATLETGVVDAGCRAHGVRNLWVASSSVFPTSGFAAPTLTIVALTLRVCEAVERELSSGLAAF
jgi:choline dehydrogenase-like flavoprotein